MSGADRTRRPVVVGVDASESARHAVEWAADVAAARGAPLHLVHVAPSHVGEGAVEDTSDPPWLRELRDAAERTGVDPVDARILPGSAADVLAGRSGDAGLVVVGSYGEGSRSGMLAGSVALTLVEASQCPVAVVRGSAPGLAPPRSGPVVVGTDAASADDEALQVGAALADALGCRLSVLHAWSDVTQDSHGLHRSTASGTELAADAEERLKECLQPVREAYPTLPVERHVVDDTALRALLQLAPGARTVVVGHRRGPQVERRLGSTSRGLVAFAPCPVVVT